ncbi:M14 family zinc carboxypeptidase [Balneolaceae bacterium ANBcel3]|nr:M14 family zinc carboxypeptidase [Balneolaceae bacterium ANBcel3]
MKKDIPEGGIIGQILEGYEAYLEPGLSHRRISHKTVCQKIRALENEPHVKVRLAGQSLEKKPVYQLTLGSGPVQVLMWSQMHGNEPTATMALFDLLKFLMVSDNFQPVRSAILERLTLHLVPVLNPDGAERFQRWNAAGIDLNRDAQMLESPESRILKHLTDEIQPQYAFNLHDQSTRYSVGNTRKHTMIAFLAPPADEARSISQGREKSMKLIAHLYSCLAEIIPGHVAAYSDEFEPRAFGDNIQKWGHSTVLIESGGEKNDREKQGLRRLNMAMYAEALYSIARGMFLDRSLDTYHSIPPNTSHIFDIVLRNVRVQIAGEEVRMDVGINREEMPDPHSEGFLTKGILAESGDLSLFFGYEELDAGGALMTPGKVAPGMRSAKSPSFVRETEYLLRQGYTAVQIMEEKVPYEIRVQVPLRILTSGETCTYGLMPGTEADVLVWKSSELFCAVIKGELIRFGYDTTE